MSWRPVEIELSEVLGNLDLSRDEKALFEKALCNDNPIITYDNFDKNVSIEDSIPLRKKGYVIGPPLGLRNYMAQVHAVLVNNAHPALQNDLGNMLDRTIDALPSTEDEIRAGNVGVYSNQPRHRFFRSQSLTIEEFNEEYLKLAEKEHTIEPEVFRQQVQALLGRVHLDQRRQAIHLTQPNQEMGGPSL